MASESQVRDLTFPESTATPNEVRSFLKNVLINMHDVPPTEAADLARKWGIGRGCELKNLYYQRYERLFGVDIGGPLYGSLVELLNKKRRSEEAQHIAEWESLPRAICFYYASRIGLVMAACVLYKSTTTPSSGSSRDALITACWFIGVPQALAYDAPDGRCGLSWVLMILSACVVLIAHHQDLRGYFVQVA